MNNNYNVHVHEHKHVCFLMRTQNFRTIDETKENCYLFRSTKNTNIGTKNIFAKYFFEFSISIYV